MDSGLVTVERHLNADTLAAQMRADVRAGMAASPKTLPATYFYDEVGSALFDDITRLQEYYPTRRERTILVQHAAEIASISGADTLVELGSGTSEKTRLLLDALAGAGTLRRFVPFDVDDVTLLRAGHAVADEYPGVNVAAVVGDFSRHVPTLPRDGRRLIAFLGSTVGNFEPAPRAQFLAGMAATMNPGDMFLLGTDLVKDAGRLVSAYDDAAGVTAAFNRNVLSVLNRELKADFDPTAFAHEAVWNVAEERIEMWLRPERAQIVTIGALDMEVGFAAGEGLRTEVSSKFRREGVEAELAAAGLDMVRWWTDPQGDFALSLSTPA
jgi:L-histidine N-alpha-methyltransferase